MRRKLFIAIVVIAMLLSTNIAQVYAYNENERLISDLLSSPGLKAGDLLNAGAQGSYGYGYSKNYSEIELVSSHTNPGSEGLTLRVFAVYGDCLEFNEEESRRTYEDGTVELGTRLTFSDGEIFYSYMDPAKHEVFREDFTSFKGVNGDEDTMLNMIMYCGEQPAGSRQLFFGTIKDSPHQATRPNSSNSIREYFKESGIDEWGNLWFYIDASKLPPNPYIEPEPPKPEFTDLATSHWAYEKIQFCISEDIMSSVGNNRFDPDGNLTRAQVAQILYNAYGGSTFPIEASSISDVLSGAWYYDAVNWLVGSNIAELSEGEIEVIDRAALTVATFNVGSFYPDEPATRGFAAEVLGKLQKKRNEIYQIVPKANFTDLIGEYAQCADAVYRLQQAGIISGFSDGTFRPEQPLTRAQMAAIIETYMGLVHA